MDIEEFCFMVNNEEENIDENLQATFKETYQNLINVNKVNNDLKMMIQALSVENEDLKSKVKRLE